MTELVIDGGGITAYSPVQAGLAALREKYRGVVFDVTTTKGLDEARKAREEIREPRYETERIRKALKAPALEYSRQVDAQAKLITEELLQIEAPVDAAIKAEEKRKEEEREEKKRKERARIQAITGRIADIKDRAVKAVRLGSAATEKLMAELEDTPIDESFAEFIDEALTAKIETLDKLAEMVAAKKADEAERERLRLDREEQERKNAEEQERLRAERAEQERRNAEEQERLRMEREEQERRNAEEQARLRAERDAQEAELAAQRTELAQREEAFAAKVQDTVPAQADEEYGPWAYLKAACEVIDAAVFSGDVLESESERLALKDYAERWLRAIEEWKQ